MPVIQKLQDLDRHTTINAHGQAPIVMEENTIVISYEQYQAFEENLRVLISNGYIAVSLFDNVPALPVVEAPEMASTAENAGKPESDEDSKQKEPAKPAEAPKQEPDKPAEAPAAPKRASRTQK